MSIGESERTAPIISWFACFGFGRAVSESILHEKLPGLNVEELEGTGLLNSQDGMVRSAAKLTPYHDLLLVSDFAPEIHRELSADHVLGVAAASLTLGSLTVRRKVKTALDIGTGAGIQAFLAETATPITSSGGTPIYGR